MSNYCHGMSAGGLGMGADGSFWGGAASPFLLASTKWSAGLGVVRVCGDGVAVVAGIRRSSHWPRFGVGGEKNLSFDTFFS